MSRLCGIWQCQTSVCIAAELSISVQPRGVELLVNGSASLGGSAGSCRTRAPGDLAAVAYSRLLGSKWAPHDCLDIYKKLAGRYGQEFMGYRSVYEVIELDNATYYPSLQYQCSEVFNGVLCDYSVNPPLSVDAEGKYLSKRSLSQQLKYVYFTSLTTTSVEYAVIAMSAVAFVAIFGTLAGLGGTQVVREGLRYLKGCFTAFILGKSNGHVVGAPGHEKQ